MVPPPPPSNAGFATTRRHLSGCFRDVNAKHGYASTSFTLFAATTSRDGSLSSWFHRFELGNYTKAKNRRRPGEMGRAPCCDKASVKKGPWSPEEDAKLKSYIEQNGTGGNWIALPPKIGLKRCGKSCRLRWLNYLRPNIRHGGFSEEEDTIICNLYISIGSRWSIIAAQLPGRTDNDIKNYWNTRLKKKLLGRRKQSRTAFSGHPLNQEDEEEGASHSHRHQALSTSALERLQLHMHLHSSLQNQNPFSFNADHALWWPTHHFLALQDKMMIHSLKHDDAAAAPAEAANLPKHNLPASVEAQGISSASLLLEQQANKRYFKILKNGVLSSSSSSSSPSSPSSEVEEGKEERWEGAFTLEASNPKDSSTILLPSSNCSMEAYAAGIQQQQQLQASKTFDQLEMELDELLNHKAAQYLSPPPPQDAEDHSTRGGAYALKHCSLDSVWCSDNDNITSSPGMIQPESMLQDYFIVAWTVFGAEEVEKNVEISRNCLE